MKSIKMLIVCILVVLFLSVVMCVNSAPAYESGFRGLKWGTKIETLKGFTLEKKEENLEIYTRKSDKLAIGDDIKLDSIHYTFYKGMLYKVLVKSKKNSKYYKILLLLRGKYGGGSTSRRFNNNSWRLTDQEILLEHNENNGGWTLEYTSTKIFDLRLKENEMRFRMERKRALDKAVNDF